MYTLSDKQQAFRLISKQLRSLAAELQIPRSRYKIHPSYGGPAVPGEAVLHADILYVQAVLFPASGLLGRSFFRQCAGIKDYVGGTNHHTRRQVPTAQEVRRALPKLFPSRTLA